MIKNEKINIVAYHGTTHHVDTFCTDHIGTGDGSQLHGWGLYFTGDKGVAEKYRTLGGNLYEINIKMGESDLLDWDNKPTKKIVNKIIKGLMDFDVDLFTHGVSIHYQKDGNNYSFDLHNGCCLYNGISSIFESDDKKTSEFLYALGIKGIKYDDRTAQMEGTHNYVIFNDKDVEIVGCNGEMLNGESKLLFGLKEAVDAVNKMNGSDTAPAPC